MKAPKQVSNFTIAPEGNHVAICYQLIHIGTIPEEYMGEMKEMNKIRLTFELCDEKKVFKEGEDQKPLVISQEYTLSMGAKANLRKLVEGIIGTSLIDDEAFDFDVDNILGKACLLNIKHKTSKAGNVRAEIATATPLHKSMIPPTQYNDTKMLTYENWDQSYFDSLPEFMREKMETSKEYKLKFTMDSDGGIPF